MEFKVPEELTYAIPETTPHNNATEKSNPLSTNKFPLSPLKTQFCKQPSIRPAAKVQSGNTRDLQLRWLHRIGQYQAPALLWEQKALTRRPPNQTLGIPSKLYYFPLDKNTNDCTVRVQKQAFCETSPDESFAGSPRERGPGAGARRLRTRQACRRAARRAAASSPSG